MTQRQTVTGFFENKSEAQQAVQRLLENGFTAEQVAFSTQPRASTTQERSSGRFFFSLFGNSDETRPTTPGQRISKARMFRERAIQVTVEVYSGPEVDRAVNLMKEAGEVTFTPPIG